MKRDYTTLIILHFVLTADQSLWKERNESSSIESDVCESLCKFSASSNEKCSTEEIATKRFLFYYFIINYKNMIYILV